MKSPLKFVSVCALVCGALAALPACETTAVNKDSKNSFLDNNDLVTMTDKMAQSITSDPDIARITAEKPMIIVIKPIVNETNQIIRGNQKELYVARVRSLLSNKPILRERFSFVLNKQDYEKLMREEGMDAAQLGPQEGRILPEYALWGHFYADTNVSNKSRSDIYFCGYKITKLSGSNAGEILWEDKYETSKSITKGFLD